MLNKVILIGRLTKDPVVNTVGNGSKVATFTLAVDRNFKDKNGERGTDFISVVAWGRTADICERFLKKGNQTGVSGRLQVRSYEGKDGSRRYVTEVVTEEITLLASSNGIAVSKPDNSETFGIEVDAPFWEEDLEEVPF